MMITPMPVETIPQAGTAVQFVGGLEYARELATWAIGELEGCSWTYGFGTYRGVDTEHVEIKLPQWSVMVRRGDWLVRTGPGRFEVHVEKSFEGKYREATLND